MAPIPIKKVISFSSESDHCQVHNLLIDKKWMTNMKDISGKASLEIEFDKPTQIHYIDIGFVNVASMDILVGLSTWPSSRDYVVLVPTINFQSSADARSERNKHGCKMLNYREHMNWDVADRSWDRVRVLINQPFARKKQMGLEFVRFGTPANANLSHIQQSSISSPDWPKPMSSPTLTGVSPFAKMMNKVKSSQSTIPNTPASLDSKLKRLFAKEDRDTFSPPMGRTAKMLLAAKLKSSKASGRANDNQIPDRDTRSPSVKRCLNLHSSKEETQPAVKSVAQSPQVATNEKFSLRATSHDIRQASYSSSPARSRPTHEHGVKSVASTSTSTNSTPTRSAGRVKNEVPQTRTTVQHAVAVHRNYDQVDRSSNQVETSPNRARDDTPTIELSANESFEGNDIEESKEPEYTEKQIKSLKKAIKRFFNTLDMDAFDTGSIKLKDLRKRFENTHGVHLNKDGRGYFKDVASRFVEILLASKQHKQRKLENEEKQSAGIKRKSSTAVGETSSSSAQSPFKLPRSEAAGSDQASVHFVQCPLCLKHFSGSVIESHAAFCGEDHAEPNYVQTAYQAEITETGGNGTVDCTENSCLSSDEQLKWIQFSREPKPYQKRLNCSQFEGCMLVRCPSCGQKYKSSEIEIHSDECAEKVNSKCTKMGLYYVQNSETIANKVDSSHGKKQTSNKPVVIE